MQKSKTHEFKAGPANTFKPVTEYTKINGMPTSVSRLVQREMVASQQASKVPDPALNKTTADPVLTKPPTKTVISKLFVESRNRDVGVYPSANHFMVSLPSTIKNVKSITLSSFSVPNIGNNKWVCVAMKIPGAEGVIQDRFAGQLPSGSLGVVDLESGGAYTIYGAGIYDSDVKLLTPEGVNLQEIEISLYAYGGNRQQPILYPLLDEVVGVELAIGQNWHAIFTIEYELSWGVSI